MAAKSKIVNRLRSLAEIDGVEVEETPSSGQIKISHRRVHSLNFRFVWSKDHYMGYFVDDKGLQSQAVVSLWTAMDAVRFASAFDILVDIRAKQ